MDSIGADGTSDSGLPGSRGRGAAGTREGEGVPGRGTRGRRGRRPGRGIGEGRPKRERGPRRKEEEVASGGEEGNQEGEALGAWELREGTGGGGESLVSQRTRVRMRVSPFRD